MTALRLVDNPSDDLRAFAYLRSPFVGLRDEVLARIRLDPQVKRTSRRPSYLEQARTYLGLVEQVRSSRFRRPRASTSTRLRPGRSARASRPSIRRIAWWIGRTTGRSWAGSWIERAIDFISCCASTRPSPWPISSGSRPCWRTTATLPLGGFLRLWDRWGEQDTGIPQAPLTSQDDDAVTLSTIHTAKGLEWPVVILAGTRGGPDPSGRMLSGTFWSDPAFGPVYMGNQAERGDRSERLFRGALAEDHAEEARLLYVAATRARDRLIISGPTEKARGYAEWLQGALADSVEAHEAPSVRAGARNGVRADGEGRDRRAAPASDDDSATGTGRQLDAFGFDHAPEDERGQLNMFAPRRDSGSEGRDGLEPRSRLPFTPAPLVLFRTPDPIQESLAPTPVELWWMDGLRECPRRPSRGRSRRRASASRVRPPSCV